MTFEPPPKLCPRCGEEYVHTVASCADCGVPLVTEGEADAARAEASGLELGEETQLVALRSAASTWISGLAEALHEAHIPCRVEVASGGGRAAGGVRCTLLVRPADADRAARIDADFARSQVPDLPPDASSAWQESEGCPACGAALAAEATECGECGLVFAGEE